MVLAVVTAAGAGCQGRDSAAARGRGVGAGGGQTRTTPGGSRGAQPDVLGATEPSAARLHDLSGDLLLYYAIHRRLPDSLEALATVVDADRTPDFTSPASGRPLVYTPSSIAPPGDDRRLVLYDPTPTRNRSYWAVLMGQPRGTQPAATWVVELPEHALRNFAAATTQPAGDVP
jgi:hypothetical protein